MDHRQIDKAFRNGRSLLKVLAQATKAVEPAESALDNPTFGLNFEAYRSTTMSDLGLHAKELLTPAQESRTSITAVKDKELQPSKQGQPSQKPFARNPVLLVGGMHQHTQQPALRIDHYLSLAP